MNKELIDEYLDATGGEETFHRMFRLVENQLQEVSKLVDIPVEVDDFSINMRKRLFDVLTYESCKNEVYYPFFSNNFTEEEIKQLIDISKYPVSVKLRDLTPTLIAISNDWVLDKGQFIIDELKKDFNF